MGVEIVGSEMAKAETVADVEKPFLAEKENGKLVKDVSGEAIKFGSQGEEPVKGEQNKAADANGPNNAKDDWTTRQIHTFYFPKHRSHEDPKIKAKIEQQDKEISKVNKARFQLIEELKANKSGRAEVLNQLKALRGDYEQYRSIMDEKKKEMEPLKQALGNLRNTNGAGGRGGLCSSEEELNDLIYSLKYHIQHESIPLSEEKQILRDIKQLEGTREKVIANAAVRTKIQDSMGQKEVIQDQVKLMGADLDGVRKEQQAVQAKRTHLRDQAAAYDKKIAAIQEELDALTEKREKAFKTIQDLRKQRDEGNANYYQSRSLVNKAKDIATRKDVNALQELNHAEVEKFMALWNGGKAFREDYKKRMLASLDQRQLSIDGRIRGPNEKPLVLPEAPAPAEVVETVVKPLKQHPKEDIKSSQPDVKPNQKSKKVDVDDEEYEIPGLDKSKKESSAEKKVDIEKLKEIKREEEIAKAKLAMERKKKLAEKAAAKAAIRAQKEAEKKLKEREKKAKKKGGSSSLEETSESAAEASEAEKVEEIPEEPVSASVPVKEKVRKEHASIRQRSRAKGPDAVPKAILKRKKSNNYWLWAASAALVVLLLIVFGYSYLL